jgi:soluble P-type ATPase
MLEVNVPGWTHLRLAHLVLDVNGTIAHDGRLLPSVPERVEALKRLLTVHLLSADTHGQLDAIGAALRVPAVRLQPGQPEADQKASFVRTLGAAEVVAIGNGANDAGMLVVAGLSGSIEDALDLLLHPKRLIGTLRR